jgi:hypothetical protein
MLVRKESNFFLYNFVLTRMTDKTVELLQIQIDLQLKFKAV